MQKTWQPEWFMQSPVVRNSTLHGSLQLLVFCCCLPVVGCVSSRKSSLSLCCASCLVPSWACFHTFRINASNNCNMHLASSPSTMVTNLLSFLAWKVLLYLFSLVPLVPTFQKQPIHGKWSLLPVTTAVPFDHLNAWLYAAASWSDPWCKLSRLTAFPDLSCKLKTRIT